MQIEKDVLKKEKDIPVPTTSKDLTAPSSGSKAPDSGKKTNYSKEHPDRHDAVVLVSAPAFLELKKLTNNSETIWWVDKHVEALGKCERSEWTLNPKP